MSGSLRIFSGCAAVGVMLVACTTVLSWRGSTWSPFESPSRSAGAEPHPVVKLDRTNHDFGRVPAGAVLEASFPIRNTGGKRLVVREKQRGCACVIVRRPEIIVPPGGTQNLTPGLDTKHVKGLLQTTIEYQTNDPNRPVFTLVLQADIEPSEDADEAEERLEPIPLDEEI